MPYDSSPVVARIRQQILVVYGTRPELIKLAPVIFEMRRRPDAFDVRVCSTGQHREMLDDLHRLFGISPDMKLDLMQPDQGLNDLASRVITAMDSVLAELRPDWMIVQGDTTTVMAASLAAYHRGIRIGHVEAGLRTGDLRAPFPEEANRSVTDLLADLLFAPTERAHRILLDEGRDATRIHLTGNTIVDALEWIADALPEEPPREEVLITVHRRESFGEPIRQIFGAIVELADRFPDYRWVFPVHRNPNVREPAEQVLRCKPNIALLDPLPYDQLVRHMRRCRLILTDSGGIQEEAPTFKKPLLVLRDKTERPEGVDIGVARLVGTERERIVAETSRLLTDTRSYDEMISRANPYGDGQASRRIGDILAAFSSPLARD